MKQLSLFDLFDELQSQSSAEKAGLLEKQSNLSSSITASNDASEVEKVTADDVIDCGLLKQFKDIKQHYEAYQQDAQDATKILGITLTHRGRSKMLFCGFPFHALNTYLPKLVRAGRRVAICDQLEDVKKATKNLPKKQVAQ